MHINIFDSKQKLGAAAAAKGAQIIRESIERRGVANVIVATGGSQIETVAALVREPDVAWPQVNFFHLDEYVGMPITHPASFRRFMWERILSPLPFPPRSYCLLDAESDLEAECKRANALIQQHPIDVCFTGIGENGHLAFNDPPANFDIEDPYIVVNLDEACRKQQVGEGWFPTLDDVPTQAISMSVKQVMKSAHIILAIPDQRKAVAAQKCFEGPVSPDAPASIVQQHPSCHIFLDKESSSLLSS